MTLQLVCVPPDRVKQVWPKVSALIYTAMKRGDFGAFKPVEDDVLNGDALLWLVTDGFEIAGACVTQIGETEWRKTCTIVAASGKMEPCIGHLQKIEEYAKAEGCSACRITGREGWSAFLTDYRPHRVVLEKDL